MFQQASIGQSARYRDGSVSRRIYRTLSQSPAHLRNSIFAGFFATNRPRMAAHARDGLDMAGRRRTRGEDPGMSRYAGRTDPTAAEPGRHRETVAAAGCAACWSPARAAPRRYQPVTAFVSAPCPPPLGAGPPEVSAGHRIDADSVAPPLNPHPSTARRGAADLDRFPASAFDGLGRRWEAAFVPRLPPWRCTCCPAAGRVRRPPHSRA